VGSSCGCAAGCSGSLRRRSWDAGGYVVGIDDGLGDIGAALPPEDGGKLLLAAFIQQEGEAVILGILNRSAAELLGDLAVGFLDIGVVGVLSIFDVALESLGLVVDGLHAGSALFVGDGCGEGLVLLLEGIDLSGLGVDGSFLGFVLFLDVENGALTFVGGDDTLLKRNDGNFCLNGFRLDLSLSGGGGSSWAGGCGSVRGLCQEGGGCEAGCQRSSKDKGTVHAVCETPYKDPDSGEIGWVTPGAKRRREGCRTFLRPLTLVSVVRLL
jgi:hypothetical protein